MKSASQTLTVRLEPIGGRGPRRIAVLVGAAALLVVSTLLHDTHLPATTWIVIQRRDSGDVLARATVDREHLIPLYERMRAALEREPEAEFLERWADPTTWSALARS